MKNPCGTTKANILEQVRINGVPVYWGTGVNPVNSPAQFFVAWGEGILTGGLIRTFNADSPERGFLWFVEEEEAEAKYGEIQESLRKMDLG